MASLSQRFLFGLLLGGSVHAAGMEQPVVAGPGNDYQASVIQPWEQAQQRIAVFERLDAAFSGDLWLTRSEDGGGSWTAPVALLSSAANERHASLIQTGAESFLLLHLSNASGGFRVHRATSTDGANFVEHGAIDLGWASAGEINPQLLREPDGSLTLVYQRLGGAAFLARSLDDGASWDTHKTQLSPGNAALPRLARRASDGRYVLFYQTGSTEVALWAKTSTDPYDWSAPAVQVVADGNNHDAWPLVTADGRFAVFWAGAVDSSFQIHVSGSPDGEVWSQPIAITARPGLKNIQPYALATALGGQAELYWGAGQVAGDADYDIVRLASVQTHQPQADLSLHGVAMENPAGCGTDIAAGFGLENAGPAPTSVLISFSSSSAAGLAGFTPPAAWECAMKETLLQCTRAAMAVDETALFEISGGTQPEDCGGQVLLTATVESPLSEDPDPADNLAVVEVSVLAAPLPVAIMRDGFETPGNGD